MCDKWNIIIEIEYIIILQKIVFLQQQKSFYHFHTIMIYRYMKISIILNQVIKCVQQSAIYTMKSKINVIIIIQWF